MLCNNFIFSFFCHSFQIFYLLSKIVCVSIISECLTRTILRDVSQGYFRRFLLDFISSIEVCMIAWETITVFSEYQSLSIFGTILYLNLLSKAYRYNILAGVSCPYTLIQSYISFFRHKVSYLSNLQNACLLHL